MLSDGVYQCAYALPLFLKDLKFYCAYFCICCFEDSFYYKENRKIWRYFLSCSDFASTQQFQDKNTKEILQCLLFHSERIIPYG